MKIILLSGHAQHGKDTSANFLKEIIEKDGKKVLITHYADLLKFLCKNMFEWNGIKDEQGRHILQYVGTDVIRKQNPDYWVGFISEFLKLFPKEWDYV
jgi:tRNA uridine 5-carbamoylmethylation protein Kti12